MSLPVACSVWFLLPDYPHNTKAWYLTEADKELAMKRCANQGKANITGKMDMALVKRMFGNWRWYVLVIMYIFVSYPGYNRDRSDTTVRQLLSSQ